MSTTEAIKKQFRKRVINQFRKVKLKGVKLLPVETVIFSESSSEHWKFLEVEGMNVLDLGCGRWDLKDINESSPVYFKKQNANRVIGVDANELEVAFFNQYFSQNFSDKSFFIHKYIKNEKQLSGLINENDITAIKCDIEGGEIHLLKLKLQDNPKIKSVAVEYHSLLLLKELINTNNKEWKFNIINHSIFSEQRNMGVVTLSR